MSQQKIHIKLQYNNEFRRFVIEPESSFNDLKQKISTILNISTPYSIRYQDEESEWITIDSDSEVQTGIELSPVLLRLQIVDSAPKTPNDPNPVPNQNSDKPQEIDIEPKWKKYRKCRKENAEKADDENDDCPKWRRKRCNKWRNQNSEKPETNDTTSETPVEGNNDDCPKWRRKRCNKWRNQNSEKADPTSEQPVEGDNDDCPKWKRFKKCRNENFEFPSDQNDCGKWRRFRKNRNENEPSDANDEMKGFRGRRGFRKWANQNDSDSESIEGKTSEEIKKEIGSLKEEIQLLMEKKKGQWQEVVGLKEKIKNLRQNNGAKEDIVKLREQIVEKKKAWKEYQLQVCSSKGRIWKLKSALEIKTD